MKKSFDLWEKTLYKEFATYYIAPVVGAVTLAAVLGLNRHRLGGITDIMKSWWKH